MGNFMVELLALHPHFSLGRSRLIALYIHGDKGRTLKKSAIMVTTLQSVVGYGFAMKRLKREQDDDVLQATYAGSRFLSRLVTSCVPKSAYDGNPEFVHVLMDVFALQLRDLLVTGLVILISPMRHGPPTFSIKHRVAHSTHAISHKMPSRGFAIQPCGRPSSA